MKRYVGVNIFPTKSIHKQLTSTAITDRLKNWA